MGRHYIPRSDVDFLVWTAAFVRTSLKNAPRLGLGAKTAIQLSQAMDDFRAAYTAHVDAHKVAATAFAAKTQSRRRFESLLRSAARDIQEWPDTTDRDRKELGIAVRKRTRSRRERRASHPVLRVDGSKHRLHVIRFSDETTPASRGKPRGVEACEIWMALTSTGLPAPPIPTNPTGRSSAYECVAMATRPPARVTFTTAQVGKTAHYIARWRTIDRTIERWSRVVSASVTG